jgi:hypothetical protein
MQAIELFAARRPMLPLDGRATLPRTLRLPTEAERSRGVVVAYATANWTVYRAVIDRLGRNERFRMETQFGNFEMSRGEFERAFSRIVQTASYQTGSPSMPGRCYYVQGPPPQGAEQFLHSRRGSSD